MKSTAELERLQAAYTHESQERGNQFLVAFAKEIREYLYFSGAYYTISLRSAKLHPNSLEVTYEQHRSDPLFDDYEKTVSVPMEYLQAEDKKEWIKEQQALKEATQVLERKTKLEKLINDLEGELKIKAIKLKELKNELALLQST